MQRPACGKFPAIRTERRSGLAPNRVVGGFSPPAPHHPPYGSAVGGSTIWHARRNDLSRVSPGLAPQGLDAEETSRRQPGIRQKRQYRRGARPVPAAFASDAMRDRRLPTDAQSLQVADLRWQPAPLFPVIHTHAAAQPLAPLRNRPVILADAKVSEPSPQEVPQFVQPIGRGNPPSTPPRCPDPVLEVRQRLVAPAHLRAAVGNPRKRRSLFGATLLLAGSSLHLRRVSRYPRIFCITRSPARWQTIPSPTPAIFRRPTSLPAAEWRRVAPPASDQRSAVAVGDRHRLRLPRSSRETRARNRAVTSIRAAARRLRRHNPSS